MIEKNSFIDKIFDKPKVISIIGDVNSGKSNLVYYFIEELKKKFKFNLYSYGLRFDLGENKIYSVEELEQIRNSIILVDEFFSILDIEDRKKRILIEKTLRLVNHNNNILILVGLPDNFKKYISGKSEITIFKRCSLAEFINGSEAKRICLSYKGEELGSSILNIGIDEFLVYNGSYHKFKVPYLKNFDSKKDNCEILKKCAK